MTKQPNYYLYHIKCIDGGHGWGETGAEAYLCMQGDIEEEARTKAAKYMPGGWVILSVNPALEDYEYLHHINAD